ncbi:CRE-TWK-11 protein [Caenorhabditis remanei]|uniref:CRE-TWK-11 protein n=1 Tax=Caenorhabditis remanei TaxID=31234 RepID=E3N1S3_CAERE|nr:CRE-TWK-11 protein [Caenorhabditis remanei]
MSLLHNRSSGSNTSYSVAFRKNREREQQAIEIDPPDDVEYDVEAGFNSSTCHLMHNFEEERPTSLVASIRESAKSSKRKINYYCSFVCTPIKNLLLTFKLLIIIGLYSFIGAHIFMYLEVPTDLEAKENGFHQRKIAREVMVLNLRAIYYDNRDDREERWKHAILKFEEDMGLEEPVVETVWTFWMSFLYAGTIFTTIGYGNIACKTQAGQIATMVYAFVGIPIMLVMLTSLNNFLLKWIKIVTNGFSDILLYVGVRLGVTVIRQDEVQKRLRYTKFAKKMKEWKLSRHAAPSSIAISSSEENRLDICPDDEDEEEMELDPPVLSTLFATVSWIMLSAAVFCLFEDWTFFTSFYFCFISLTTIGLGDVTPANPEYMIATFGVVIVGLSMLTVCIDVIKEKLAQMYMALLQKLLREYMEAVKSGDPNAASAMMAGFQGRAKFLMPLISKNEGAKVMDKFKQDCSKKGIDPPPVLTNINPETGMPAFANAPKEDFRDYIDVVSDLGLIIWTWPVRAANKLAAEQRINMQLVQGQVDRALFVAEKLNHLEEELFTKPVDLDREVSDRGFRNREVIGVGSGDEHRVIPPTAATTTRTRSLSPNSGTNTQHPYTPVVARHQVPSFLMASHSNDLLQGVESEHESQEDVNRTFPTGLKEEARDDAESILAESPDTTFDDNVQEMKEMLVDTNHRQRSKALSRSSKKVTGESAELFFHRISELARQSYSGNTTSKKEVAPEKFLIDLNPDSKSLVWLRTQATPEEAHSDAVSVDSSSTSGDQTSQADPPSAMAEERFAEEQQKLTQTPLSKSTDFLQSPTPRPTVSAAVTQTSSPPPTVSLEVQAGTTMGKFHDYGSQTQQESSDEGIQTDYSMDFDDEKRKEPEKVMADAGTQYEIVLLTSIGIQPEVSSIYIGADQSDHSDEESAFHDSDDDSEYLSSESEEERTPKYKETTLPFEVDDPGTLALGLQSPPIEITPFSDDESVPPNEGSPVPTSSKPTTKNLKPAKVSKSASMDSTDTVIHVKPDDRKEANKDTEDKEKQELSKEEKRERRKKRKRMRSKKTREHELRFLKNSGNQTSPVLMDCSTQYEIFTIDSGSQYDVKGRSRKCQTKLSSINHEQLQGIRETVQKLRRRESEMSKVSNVSESDWDSGREDVAEISLDLSVIALGVDEAGRVVEVPKAALPQESLSPSSETGTGTGASESSPSAEKVHLDSEDEEIESLEELELYTTDTGIQTETKVMVDSQDFATPKALEIIKNCSTQTTFSTFHLPQKVYESASTSSDEDVSNDNNEEDRDKKTEQEVFFMTNTGVQTMHTSFHLEEKPKTEEQLQTQTQVESETETETETAPDEMPLFLKNSDCQTENLGMVECSTSTEDVRFVGDAETSEGFSQTVIETEDLQVQTIVRDCKFENLLSSDSQLFSDLETTMQTEEPDLITDACQTDPSEGMEVHVQTEAPETRSFICQTELSSSLEAEVQAAATVETMPIECQTESVDHGEVEVQTELETSASESQTEGVVVDDLEMQTDIIESVTSVCQTEKVVVDDIEMQTDQIDMEASESQTERISVDEVEMQTDEKDTLASESQTEAPPTVEMQQTQTDDTTINTLPSVDQITQSEIAEVKDSTTQYTLSLEDRDVQATPISFETQTQHSIEIEVKSCQTEGVRMKNKKSQVEDDSPLAILKIDNESQIEVDRESINLSPIRLDVSHSFTMTEPGASEEKEVQVDEDCFEPEETSQRFYAGPLWSDFDYTPALGDDEEEVMDGETQTQDGSDEHVEEDDDGEDDEGAPEVQGEAPEAHESVSGETGAETTAKSKKTKKRRVVKKSGSGSRSSEDLLGSSGTKRSSDSLAGSSSELGSPPDPADEFAVQCSPESSDIKTQTVKFVKKKKRTEQSAEPKVVEMSTSTVQATTEMCEQSAGDMEDDWLQVYVQELDEERRMRMSDIGIQTGVLARVQHIYTRPISDDQGATSSATAPITLRKSSDSSDHISIRTAKSSEESLAPSASGTAISAAESMDDRLWPERPSPFASRHSSLKRRKKEPDAEKKGDKTNIVQDLRARFEMKSPAPPKSPPKDEGEGSSSSDPKQFF